MREFAAAGATVVTTPGDGDLARRVLSRHLGASMGAGPAARAATITGRPRVFTHGARAVEIHDVGLCPHADEMPVAWLPAEAIRFRADRVEAPGDVARRGAKAETTVHLAGRLRRKGWAARASGGARAFLANPAELEKPFRERILPPT